MRSSLLAILVSLVAASACKPSGDTPSAAAAEAENAATAEAPAEEAGEAAAGGNAEEAAAPDDEAPEAAAPAEEAAEAAAPADGSGDPLAAPADVAAPPEDAEVTASGLASRVLQPGTGTEHPTATSVVEVHYTGWTTDGERFDSSVERGQPAQFPLNRVIPGWTEGVQLMVVGEKRRFWIPVELAYNNRPGAPAGMLVFDVELLGIR